MGGGIHGYPIQFVDRFARERRRSHDGLHKIAEEVDSNGSFLLVHRIDIHHISANTEVPSGEVVISTSRTGSPPASSDTSSLASVLPFSMVRSMP